MSDFMAGKGGYEGGVKGEILVGRVEEIKSAPQHGQKRIIVREKHTRRSAAIDIPTKQTKNVERKETYTFDVQEKDESERYGGIGKRKSSSGFRNFYSESEPEPHGLSSKDYMKRFGGGKTSSRTKF